MAEHVTPNPYSPYATADPRYRHLFAAPVFFPAPAPGVLALAGCGHLAVVPDEPMRDAQGQAELPDGLCPKCVASMREDSIVEQAPVMADCSECDSSTYHDGLCALCRAEKHETWSGRA